MDIEAMINQGTVTRHGNFRDNNRAGIYLAERRWKEQVGSKDFKTVEQCQAYVDKVLASARFRQLWGSNMRIEVRPGYGHRNATGGYGVIQLPKWARTEWVILHEMAHCVTSRKVAGRTAPHGPQFAAVLLTLTRMQRGVKAFEALRWHILDCCKGRDKIDWTAIPKARKGVKR